MGLAGGDELNALTSRVIAAGIEVHRALGPGLLESAYRACMVMELRHNGLAVDVERELPVIYRGVPVHCAFRVDLIVGGRVLVELKCVEQFAPIHHAQLLTYLRITGCPVGLLMNFQVPVLTAGIRRVLNAGSLGSGPSMPRTD